MCNLHKRLKKTQKFDGYEWTENDIYHYHDTLVDLAKPFDWNGYDVQYEILDAEQFFAKCSTVGIPTTYAYWGYGKEFVRQLQDYNEGKAGLPYEMIINSDPSICYLNADNSPAMQLIVLAHAAIGGHNHFFKHNYLFKEHTHAKSALNMFIGIKETVEEIEQRRGQKEVEFILTGLKALSNVSYDKEGRYRIPRRQTQKSLIQDLNTLDSMFNPVTDIRKTYEDVKQPNPLLGSENLLSLVAELTPNEDIRTLAKLIQKETQYFYPQIRTKMINEGFAQYTEHTLMHQLFKHGHIKDNYMLEYIDDNGGVMFQLPSTGNKRRDGSLAFYPINPYFLGFNLMKDIERVCLEQKDEDLYYVPTLKGVKPHEAINNLVRNYNDETAILQYLTPHLMKKLKMFRLFTTAEMDHYLIKSHHTDEDYEDIKQTLARQYSSDFYFPRMSLGRLTDTVVELHYHPSVAGNTLNLDEDIGNDDVLDYFHVYFRAFLEHDVTIYNTGDKRYIF